MLLLPETLSEAVKILKVEYLVRAINEHQMDQAIIFCRTKLDCDNTEEYLISQGGGAKAMVNEYSCVCLHSDRPPNERKGNLKAFKVIMYNNLVSSQVLLLFICLFVCLFVCLFCEVAFAFILFLFFVLF